MRNEAAVRTAVCRGWVSSAYINDNLYTSAANCKNLPFVGAAHYARTLRCAGLMFDSIEGY